jgi:DnaJ-class molecular chaperone
MVKIYNNIRVRKIADQILCNTRTEKTCRSCRGSGKKQVEYKDRRIEIECPICRGHGYTVTVK